MFIKEHQRYPDFQPVKFNRFFNIRFLLSVVVVFLSFVHLRAQSKHQAVFSKNLLFEENKGQLTDGTGEKLPEVLYKGNVGNGTSVYFFKNKISYVMSQMEGSEEEEEEEEKEGTDSKNNETVQLSRVDVEFPGCNTSVNIIASDQKTDVNRYYLPSCKEGTLTSSYGILKYENLYPNIDVLFKGGTTGTMEYDFIVKPGGNPDDIKWIYSGAASIEVDNAAKYPTLIIRNGIGEIRESIPSIYQIINKKRIELKGNYSRGEKKTVSARKDNPGNTAYEEISIGIQIDNYDKTFPLIIDPWTTYYGGSRSDHAQGVTTDVLGNVLVVGETQSINFPVTAGSYQTSFVGTQYDAFVVKFNPAGNRLWATYYGGSAWDHGNSITADGLNNVLITGGTNSNDFPVTAAAFQSHYNGGTLGNAFGDAFIVKFNSSGIRQWATYCGGTSVENGDPFNWQTGGTISTDGSNNVIILGSTQSVDFPVFNASQVNKSGDIDAFLFKFDPAGNRLWATYYGGSKDDSPGGITVDTHDNIIITGVTKSTDLWVPNAFQAVNAGTNNAGTYLDVFVVKFDPAGNVQWGTYYGGSGSEAAGTPGIASDAQDNVAIIGTTGSINLPVLNAFQPNLSGPDIDAFLVKFDPLGNRLWATYLGGTSVEEGYGIAMDENYNVIAAGDTYSNDFPISSCAFQTNNGGGHEDNFITKFDLSGTMLCSGYVGGTGHDETHGGNIVSLNADNIYLVGSVYKLTGVNSSFPVTPGAFQTLYAGEDEAYLAQICTYSCGLKSISTSHISANKNNICVGDNVSFDCSILANCMHITSLSWTFPGGNPAVSSVQNPTVAYSAAGFYDVKLVATGDCGTDSILLPLYIKVYNPATLITSPDVSICLGTSATLTATTNSGTSGTDYTWSPPYALDTLKGPEVIASPSVNTLYTISGACSEKESIVVTVYSLPSVSLSPFPSVCLDSAVTLTASGTISYLWKPAFSLNMTSGPVVISTTSVGVVYSVTGIDQNNCSSKPQSVNVFPQPKVKFTADTFIGCAPLCVNFINQITSLYPKNCVWNFGDGTTSTTCTAKKHCYVNSGIYDVKLYTIDFNNCSDSLEIKNMITVYALPTANYYASPQPTTIFNPAIQFTDASFFNVISWSWNFGDKQNTSSMIQNPLFTYADTGNYVVQLIVKDLNNCIDTIKMNILINPDFVFYVPNSFSPNNDGKNDIFLPLTQVIYPDSYRMFIFDRWGNKIFESNDPKKGWDGKVKNKIAQEDVYIYSITLQDYARKNLTFNGPITLIK